MAKLTPQEAQISDWLAAQKEAMLGLLAELVNTDSGSYDKAGVEAVGERLIRFFEENGLPVAVEPHETFAPAIHVRLDDTRANERPIVLMGHRDTVFPKGEAVHKEIKDAAHEWRFENKIHPSLTEQKAAIVEIGAVSRA